MKKLFPKLFTAFLLMAAAPQAKAALFINNNTGCDITMELYAHDFNHGTCVLHSGWFVVPAYNSVAYNNVTTLNSGTPSWLNGPAVLTGGTTVWGWDATKFYFGLAGGSGVVGAAGSCIPNASTVIPNTCGSSVTVTWGPFGSNTVIDIN
ncbi:hypothetical protein [Taibaiella koreensis]|uniref:hypothetical protein n=1 Tax=Taibaiella koreensis TaxID=1268548 RepID=UPI000E59B985|nr:hypothetical protein [Taibaiella koreensis]